ncbi:Chromate transporter [Tenacibaculum litopenaei]|uniref:chromate efflux transporter n=1 Tax=Tenacibaculum litopenaei TaxID=396016 RepID=UPI003893761D
MATVETNSKGNLREIAGLFFKLGCIAFGGPAAHIAMMEEEVVQKRKWMTEQHFLDLIGATNLIPGPNSTELTMHCGQERAGWKGLLVAGISFIFPAALVTALFAHLYLSYGTLPDVAPFIFGIKPAVLAIIASAAHKLSKKAITSNFYAVVGVLVFLLSLKGINEFTLLFATAILGILLSLRSAKSVPSVTIVPYFLGTTGISHMPPLQLFLSFLKIGSILYGSGYVLFAFLDTELVQTGWLTRQVLLDAVAVGQLTPGPILTTATFIGWQLHGFYGALLATLGIFLPSFVFVLLLNPILPKIRASAKISRVLDLVNVAAVALIFSVCAQMGTEILIDWKPLSIGILSFIAVFFYKKLSSIYIIIGGSILGYLLHLIG